MKALTKKLGADATAQDYIHDFVNSSDKRFAGKSKKERIRMALGAFYGRGKAADIMSRADAAIAKSYDPGQPRDWHGRWSDEGGGDEGFGGHRTHITATDVFMHGTARGGGSGGSQSHDSSDGGGGYPYGTKAKDKKWRDLTEGEKKARVGEIIEELDRRATHPNTDPLTRARSKAKLDEFLKLGLDPSREGTTKLYAAASSYHHERLNRIEATSRAADQERLAADPDAQEVLGGSSSNVQLSIHDTNQLQPGWRRTIAEVSSKVASALRAAKLVVDTINQVGGANTPEISQHSAQILGALTTAAAGVNLASRARDANTAATGVKSVQRAVSTLRTELPDTWDAVKEGKKHVAGRFETHVSAASRKLDELDLKLRNMEIAHQTSSAAFRLGGGRVVSHPYKPRTSGLHTSFAPRTRHAPATGPERVRPNVAPTPRVITHPTPKPTYYRGATFHVPKKD